MPFRMNVPPLARPTSTQKPHTFRRLRSFYLSPPPTKPEFDSSPKSSSSFGTPTSSPGSETAFSSNSRRTVGRATRKTGAVLALMARRPRSFQGSTFALSMLALSLFVIMCLSLAFVGAEVGSGTQFKETLDRVATEDPGLVLVGENVDVDIDEPSVGIRWSLVACGQGYVLPGSYGILGSSFCGLPVQDLEIFVDAKPTPVAVYSPTEIPFSTLSGTRRNIESLVRFGTDHVLDVHKARLYPFDRYRLSSSFRATTLVGNETVRISRIITTSITLSFDISTSDLETFVTTTASAVPSTSGPTSSNMSSGTSLPSVVASSTVPSVTATISTTSTVVRRAAELNSSFPVSSMATTDSKETPPHELLMIPHLPSRDFDMLLTRPPSAQFFTFVLFAVSWVLTHAILGFTVIDWMGRSQDMPRREGEGDYKHLSHILMAGLALFVTPQIRNSMPACPGLDGLLLDCIGFFPQMIILVTCFIALLLALAAGEIDDLKNRAMDTRPTSPPRPRRPDSVECEAGHRAPHHCCRSSLISSFPHPPSGTAQSPSTDFAWKGFPSPPPGAGHAGSFASLRTTTLPSSARSPFPLSPGASANATGFSGGGRKPPPKPLSLKPRTGSLIERYEFLNEDEQDGDVEMGSGARRAISSASHRREATVMSPSDVQCEVSKWSDHEDD